MSSDSDEDDLWGALPDVTKIELPEEILFHQADILTRKTQGALVGEVRRVDTDSNLYRLLDKHCDIEWSLEIRVPRMDDYRYQLLLVGHSIHLYPVYILALHDGWETSRCNDTKELKAAIKEIFRHYDTQAVLGSLLAQSQDPRSRLRAKRALEDDDIPF